MLIGLLKKKLRIYKFCFVLWFFALFFFWFTNWVNAKEIALMYSLSNGTVTHVYNDFDFYNNGYRVLWTEWDFNSRWALLRSDEHIYIFARYSFNNVNYSVGAKLLELPTADEDWCSIWTPPTITYPPTTVWLEILSGSYTRNGSSACINLKTNRWYGIHFKFTPHIIESYITQWKAEGISMDFSRMETIDSFVQWFGFDRIDDSIYIHSDDWWLWSSTNEERVSWTEQVRWLNPWMCYNNLYREDNSILQAKIRDFNYHRQTGSNLVWYQDILPFSWEDRIQLFYETMVANPKPFSMGRWNPMDLAIGPLIASWATYFDTRPHQYASISRIKEYCYTLSRPTDGNKDFIYLEDEVPEWTDESWYWTWINWELVEMDFSRNVLDRAEKFKTFINPMTYLNNFKSSIEEGKSWFFEYLQVNRCTNWVMPYAGKMRDLILWIPFFLLVISIYRKYA